MAKLGVRKHVLKELPAGIHKLQGVPYNFIVYCLEKKLC